MRLAALGEQIRAHRKRQRVDVRLPKAVLWQKLRTLERRAQRAAPA